MSPTELLIILAMTGYAVYQQTRRHELNGAKRFKLAIIYIVVGLCVGGMHLPNSPLAVLFLGLSIALSLVVGLVRGRLTTLWVEDGRMYSQGTALTVGLFLGMIAVKFGLGTIAYFAHVNESGGIGEILLMVGVMVAVQAQMIWNRAQRLAPQDALASGSHPAVAR